MNKNNAHYRQAMKSIKNNNVSDAIDELKLCLKFNSKSVDALNLLGLSYYLKCRFDKAEKTWKKSLSLKRENNKARDYLELITKKDFKEIRKEYKKILFNDKADREEKIKFLKKLIEEYDELIEPYVILGLLYKKENNYSEALKYFYKAYELDSGNQNIKNYIMECEKEDENSSNFNIKSNTNRKSALIAGILALIIFTALINLSGISPFAIIEENINGVNLSQSQKQSGKSQKQSQNQAQNDSDSTDVSQNDSKTADNQNDKESARRAEENSQNKQQTETASAQTKNENSSSKVSESDAQENTDSAPKKPLSELNLMSYVNDDPVVSIETIKELREKEEQRKNLNEQKEYLEEGNEQQLFNLGMDYFQQGNYKEAVEIFKSIYNLTETDYLRRESLFLLGRSYEKMGENKSAEHYYRIYLDEYPETNYHDEVLYNLGLMLNEAGNAEESREVLQRLRREHPYSEYNNSEVYDILNN